MKKLSLTALLATSALFGATDAQIIDFYKRMVPENVSVTIEQRDQNPQIKGYDIVTVKLSDGNQTQSDTIFAKDGLIFPDIIELSSGKSSKQDIEHKAAAKKLGEIYKKESKNNIITLGNDKNKETIVYFTDPECPYCREDLKNINDKLTVNNIKIIITSVHDKQALQKASNIYAESKKAKTDADKIAILKKYYDPESKVTENEAQIQKMDELRRSYLSNGLRGVPFSINEKELTK